jgi:hypothetical protein
LVVEVVQAVGLEEVVVLEVLLKRLMTRLTA